MLLMHLIPCALVFALASAGNNRPARMAMIAMTTNNSIKVKPFGRADPRECAAGTPGNEFAITRCSSGDTLAPNRISRRLSGSPAPVIPISSP